MNLLHECQLVDLKLQKSLNTESVSFYQRYVDLATSLFFYLFENSVNSLS